MNIEVKERKGEECQELRSLWENVFYEDSKEFNDYYFKEKANRNHAFVVEVNENDTITIAAMLHLSPYSMKLRVGNEFCNKTINYIVGVATKAPYRHKGYMDCLLKTSFMFMYKEEMPFTFLMPANPKIYEPYQFTYIYNKKEYAVDLSMLKKEELKAASSIINKADTIEVLQESGIPELLNYINPKLEDAYDVFVKRDKEYYQTMNKELSAQNGRIYRIGKNKITGYFLYTQENGKGVVQEAVFDEKSRIFKEDGFKPMIMARIINLCSMLSLLRLKHMLGMKECILIMRVEDRMIEANSGVWECVLTEKSAEIRKIEDAKQEECGITVEHLTAWMFGYKSAEECFYISNKKNKEAILCKLNNIGKFSNVFINEIV